MPFGVKVKKGRACAESLDANAARYEAFPVISFSYNWRGSGHVAEDLMAEGKWTLPIRVVHCTW